MCVHGALCSISFNLICNMTIFRRKKNVLTFATPQGLRVCVLKNRICDCMVLYLI